MRHTFRINVYGKGYTLFSGESQLQYQEFPLDILSIGISRNYLSAQKRIDTMLETKIPRWHFCITNLSSHERPVVAYGCLLPIEDDTGRTGVSFIHALESDDLLRIDEVVVCLIQLLSQQGIGEISELLVGLTKGDVTSERAIEFLTSKFSRPYRRPTSLPANKGSPIKEIQHDCGGVTAIAWLAMAISHLDASSPWEIYEEHSRHSGLISTISSCASASEAYLLSEYLYQSIYAEVNRSQKEGQPTEKLLETRTESMLSSENISNPRDDSDKHFDNQNAYYPPGGHVVRMDGLNENKLSLNDDTFFDIHMHALNLSHPYFYAFIKRYKLDMRWFLGIGIISLLAYVAGRIPFLGNAVRGFITRKQNTFNNLLSVFENDIGSFFLITEDCLREKENPLLNGGELSIGTRKYKRMVLTPLMMDFGYKGKKEASDFHYSRPSEKPIVEQVTDVFNAIKKYKQSVAIRPDDDLCQKFPFLKPGTKRVIEIYPFLGINTQNYTLDKIKTMLDQYFNAYKGLREDLLNNLNNMDKFDGNIGKIQSNYFAGVKVYPPLGFNPWPGDGEEQKKVDYLYTYCVQHGIPITSHGGDGGFVDIDDKNDLRDYTSMSRWESVLEHYPSLKLNIAHFPAESWPRRLLAKPHYRLEKQRLMAIIDLVTKKDNVYTDFSCWALSDNYYMYLKEVINSRSSEDDKLKLRSRILFGSDYAVNLGSIESYNQYLDIFSRTKHLTAEEKHLFCSVNPERFLFSAGKP